jgi:hypothetical protein
VNGHFATVVSVEFVRKRHVSHSYFEVFLSLEDSIYRTRVTGRWVSPVSPGQKIEVEPLDKGGRKLLMIGIDGMDLASLV